MKKIISFILLCCAFLYVLSFNNVLAINNEAKRPEEFYTPINGYFYQVELPLNASLDSVEAWVRLPHGSTGGCILSSGHSTRTTWTVDINGRFGFHWNNSVTYTFSDSESLADGVWHHVALVRTNSEFTYYLDGEVESVYTVVSSSYIEDIQLNFGVNKTNNRNEFEGYIAQVTLYTGAISQEQIQNDMVNIEINHKNTLDNSTKLLGNWYLGEYWTERSILNTVEDAPKAELHTFNKMFEVDWSFEYDYSFAIFPDIQIMTNYNEAKLNRQQQWLADNKEKYNIQFAMFDGDLSDFGQKPELYQRAANAMSRLDNIVPYCFAPGNHDYDDNASTRAQETFKKYFPVSKHSQLPGFGGLYEDDKMSNSYYTFNACGVDYLVINLEFKPRLSVLRWANVIVEAHPNHRVIMNTHSYLTAETLFSGDKKVGNEGNGGQVIFDEFMVKHPNIFMGVGGHETNDEAFSRIDYGENGNQIISILADAQTCTYKGAGTMDVFLLIFVNETNKTMNFIYYSPEHDKAYNIQNQYQISFADPNNPAIGA